MERRIVSWLFAAALLTLLLVWFVGVAGCRPPYMGGVCQVGEMRCHDNVAEICASDRTWVPALDCRAISENVGRPWVCVATPSDAGPLGDEEFTCEPAREADAS